jgi:hypothetical protein
MTRVRARCLATWLCGVLAVACGDDDHQEGAADASAMHDGGSGGRAHLDSGPPDSGHGRHRDAALPRDAAIDTGIVESTPGQCPGAGTPIPGRQCRSDADCDAANPRCARDALPAGAGCATCSPNPPHLCDKNADCAAGSICAPIDEVNPCPCVPITQPGTHCISKCTSSSCPPAQRCESDGLCHIRPCDDGYECAGGLKCAPKDDGADDHGCAPKRCAIDGYTCPEDFVCGDGLNTDVHGCSEVSCKDGFTCAPNYDCDPKSKGHHHCEQRACKADSECDCGFCIQDHCEPRLFVCTGAQPP